MDGPCAPMVFFASKRHHQSQIDIMGLHPEVLLSDFYGWIPEAFLFTDENNNNKNLFDLVSNALFGLGIG